MEEKKDIIKNIESIVDVLKVVFYVLSVVYPLFGIIAGIVLQNKKFGAETNVIGKTCFWIGIIVSVIMGLIVFIVLRLLSKI